jgi:hypothetical protein
MNGIKTRAKLNGPTEKVTGISPGIFVRIYRAYAGITVCTEFTVIEDCHKFIIKLVMLVSWPIGREAMTRSQKLCCNIDGPKKYNRQHLFWLRLNY